jgi:trigger factor
MKIEELKNDKTEYTAKIIFANKDINTLIDKELVTIAKTAKMDGFRVGKVPAIVLKKKYASSIRADIVRKKINDAVDETIKKNKLNVALDPAIENLKNEEGKDLEFTLKFELLPEIKLPDFKKISIEKAKLEVSKKDIDEQLERLASFSKNYTEESKAKAKDGDQLTIDAIGYVDGKAFEGGKLTAHKLVLGSKTFIPGFEDQLIGTKTGDDVTVKVDFPKDYHAKELAGKPSEFKVQVKAIHKPSAVKIDDEFAKKFHAESVEKLKEQIAKNIEAGYNEAIHTMMKMHLFNKLESVLKFDVPESLLKQELSALQRQQAMETHNHEHDADCDHGDNCDHDHKATSKKKQSSKTKDAELEKIASRRVKIGLMLAEYVKQHKIQVKEEDIRQAIIAQARNYPGQEREVIEFYQKNRDALESLRGPIIEEKAVKAIFDKEVIISEKSYPREKLEALLEKEMKD